MKRSAGLLSLAFLASLLAAPARAGEAGALVDVADAGPAVICFTSGNESAPGADCAALIAAEIGRARRQVLVQAYNFTEPRIAQALMAARQRGLDVEVLLDKSAPGERGGQAAALARAGIAEWIDARPRIAHSKVVVIDGATTITGSFNFTASAQRANAENLIVLRSPEVASAYVANFARRRAVSEPYAPG